MNHLSVGVVPEMHGTQNLAIGDIGIHPLDLVLEVEVIQLLVLDVHELLKEEDDDEKKTGRAEERWVSREAVPFM